ncbi:helix-turn-helix domain-containing protein [Viridibacillus sp. FSL E2-0187]|uniref:response regulator transcription factor n=1 Tax=Viridibacillus TaxID=496496 RepID=UPI0030F577E9
MTEKIKVIVVDDESRLRRGIEKLIRSNGEEWEIVGSYATGQSCLDDVVKLDLPFDVLFTDVKMPLMSGLELLTRLNERVSKSYYAVIISGYDDFEFIQKAMREGALDYLLKPIDRLEMQVCLDKIKAKFHKNEVLAEPESKNISIEIATQWIHEHLHEPLTIEKIAGKVFMNATYFSEYFKRKTGETVLDYITKKRMEKAITLLKTTNMKIYEISLATGYTDTKYFSKLFKKHYGMLPSQIRHGE